MCAIFWALIRLFQYPRSCDIARYNMWKENGVFDALTKKGVRIAERACASELVGERVKECECFVSEGVIACARVSWWVSE